MTVPLSPSYAIKYMKHFVFDLDGTLIDSHSPYHETMHLVFNRYKDEATKIDYSLIRKVFAHKFMSLHIPQERMEAAYDYYMQLSMNQVDQIRPFDGIVEMLQYLTKKNVPIAIWTGREKKTAVEVLEKTGLGRFAKQIVTGDCVNNNKPNPDGLLKILKENQWLAENAVMIGDSDFDVMGARGAQVRAVSVGWGSNPDATTLSQISDHHFDDVSAFHRWVAEIF